MSIYRREKVWWGRLQIAGREHRRSLRTGSKPEAKLRFEAWRRSLIEQAHFGIERHTWQEAVARYLTDVLSRVAPSTADRYHSSLKGVARHLDGMEVAAVNRRALAPLLDRPGVSQSTKNRDVTAVMAVLRACEQWGWIETLPLPPRAKERRDPISLPDPADVDRLVAACAKTGGTLHYLVMLLRQTGMRLEEAGSLTWAQIDSNRRAITLTRTKRGRVRAVPITGTAAGTLQRVPRRLGVPWVFWHGEQGLRYGNLSSRLLLIGKRVAFPNRIHDLRHLFAVEYMRGGGSIYDLQKILGHASIVTTEIYLDFLDPAEQARAMGVGS